MSSEWIIIEVIAIFIEGLTKVYFLNSRYASKFKSIVPQLIAWLCLFGWGIIATFSGFPILPYEGMICLIILTYLLLTKYGSFGQKLFGLVLTLAISIGSSLAGAGLASLISNVSMTHTQVYQDSSRLLALILIKAIEIILFYGLAKRHYPLRVLQRKPVIVLTCAVIMIFSCFLFMFFSLSNFDEQANYILIWLAAGMLFILIGVFVMHEMFIREETRNINLSTRLQRLEMESHFFKELGVIQTDLRTWQHEYKNNLLALRALVEEGSSEKTLIYLDKISGESFQENTMLHTGNTVLDAVVSSKLMLARSTGIEISIQAVYPEINQIEDNDLCAIAGNLLDNAIEACERMGKTEKTRFITFSLLVKGKNLVISILNSYNGEIKRAGDRYLTIKENSLHGIGIQYIDSIVEKYQGHVLRTYQDGVFETHVMLPLILS
jgi:hypothetical protein